MTALEPTEEDLIFKRVLQRLSKTPYACSSLSQLSTRPANFVFRGVLAQPIHTQDGAAGTIIIKHSTDPHASYQAFEESLLNALARFTALDIATSIVITTPRLCLFDRETDIQVLEDFTGTDGFKWVLYSANADKLLPQPSPALIGRQLGSWLRSFHEWTSAPEQAALRAQMWQNDPMRKVKYGYTYGSFLPVLENYPELLDGYRETLETIRDAIAKEFEKSSTESGDSWGLVHGDFWTGNILIPTTPWREPPVADETNKLFIIDWEFAQFGHRSYDLGQIVGDLYERKVFNDNAAGISTMEGVINGYGKLSDEMAFRTAIYVGVHLIGWYKRRPQKVIPPEIIVAGLTIGRDFIIKGWEKDRKFFEGSGLASLFVVNDRGVTKS
ncbi:kinase-like domain-containing protein [Truncatella angustata]|uniref:Kinase-like domain-containing protein n=1 Tax=Truncatella angustata TaxID=152316 RepID=A0A9P8UVE4_9PEZI|nr:kinase-like domain-containing protein [Truncatella angustata]KAH6658913.1 kinase-like domain-containing protein [Truncatella angustata]KAH8196259.1 hypothetical protein TruAng_009584 [Truncatella angustata]